MAISDVAIANMTTAGWDSGALAIKGLVVAFGGLRALDGFSATIDTKQITGLIGPNGSGKSTLVNTVSGQLRPSGGVIRLGDTVLTALRADRIVRHGLARTYQIPRVPPQLTVQEVIAVPIIYGRGPTHLLAGLSDAASVAEYCGLGRLLRRACAQLTVSDLRRLEIARALACGPSLLLLDEVMAGLSHDDSVEVMALIRRVHEGGVGVVIIEHVMRVIRTLCDRVIVLNNGRLLASGAPSAVLADPAVREAYLGKGFTG
jgi:branched-chain amino acid transport system ATP-binding protein